MNQHESENDRLLNSVKQQLDDSADELDASTLRDLRRARAVALDTHARIEKNRLNRFSWWFPRATAVAAGVFSLVFALQFLTPVQPDTTALDDLPLFSSSDELELYEDIDFIYWLESEALPG